MNRRENFANTNAWRRIIFPISQCNGKILLKNFKESSLDKKTTIKDLHIAFSLLEKSTYKFQNQRRCFIIKVCIICLSLLLFLLSLAFFLIMKKILAGVGLVILSCIFISIYIFCVTNKYKLQIKADLKKIYPVLKEINMRLFVDNSLYLMINPDFNFFSLYIIPPFIQVNFKINNFFYSGTSKTKKTDIESSYYKKSLDTANTNNVGDIAYDNLSRKPLNKERNKDNSFFDIVL